MRYLRPAYQVPAGHGPGQQQGTMTLTTAVAVAADVTPAETQPWPTELAQQMQALRAVVQGAAAPLTAKQAAARFRGTKAAKVQPLLDTLVSLALLRHVPELDAYAT